MKPDALAIANYVLKLAQEQGKAFFQNLTDRLAEKGRAAMMKESV